jgi:hypothetical protein
MAAVDEANLIPCTSLRGKIGHPANAERPYSENRLLDGEVHREWRRSERVRACRG